MVFKEKAPDMSSQEIEDYYKLLARQHLNRKTDLNKKSVSLIQNHIKGSKVLDIACGRGFLVQQIHEKDPSIHIYGVDFILHPDLKNKENMTFVQGNIENIPFDDGFFDTVICTHTLEHVQNIQKALSELRRVTSKRLIIVVPRQRPYRYTFDLHLHFFPYLFSLKQVMRNPKGEYRVVGNDFFYVEDRK